VRLVTNILIAEDDVFISEHLSQILKGLGYKVSGIVSSYQQAENFITDNELPDLALLDIRMHNEDQGVEIAKLLNTKAVPFVFITSFSDKKTVQQAVEQQPKGYILKPFEADEIEKIVTNVLAENQTKFIYTKDNFITNKIPIADILWVKSDNVYVEIKTSQKTFVHRASLPDMIKVLPEKEFTRVHRSYLVRNDSVQKINTNSVTINQEEIPVSKSYKEAVKGLMV
jgi:two-component system, LytTR family, response regulator LytT